MCTFMCTFKVHIKSVRTHVHIYVHFESAHVHFKGAHVHFHSAHVHFLCSKSNSTSTPALLLPLKKCGHTSQWFLHGVRVLYDIYTVSSAYRA